MEKLLDVILQLQKEKTENYYKGKTSGKKEIIELLENVKQHYKEKYAEVEKIGIDNFIYNNYNLNTDIINYYKTTKEELFSKYKKEVEEKLQYIKFIDFTIDTIYENF